MTAPRKYIKLFVVISVFALVLGTVFILSKQEDSPNQQLSQQEKSGKIISGKFDEKLFKTDAEWKEQLTPEQFHILREAGTEIPFTGALYNEKRKGTYYSAGCEKPLFRSEKKYDSGTGWPSFWAPISDDGLVLREESAPGDDRIEVLDTCGNHLGHVFDDGPQPTGKRYCMNSAALRFVPDER